MALLPFARNAATEAISPTTTPEYLAAGALAVSTEIRDVIRPYGKQEIVRVAQGADDLEAAIKAALREDNSARQAKADALLAWMSWDRSWQEMEQLINQACPARATSAAGEAALRPPRQIEQPGRGVPEA